MVRKGLKCDDIFKTDRQIRKGFKSKLRKFSGTPAEKIIRTRMKKALKEKKRVCKKLGLK